MIIDYFTSTPFIFYQKPDFNVVWKHKAQRHGTATYGNVIL